MNILFITNKNVNPIIGGIERITHVLAVGFAELHGHRCFSAFTQRLDYTKTPFEKELLLQQGRETEMLSGFIRENGIQVVIAQGADAAVNAIVGQIHDAVAGVKGCKMIFVFHNKPGFEYTLMSFDVLRYRIMHGQDVAYNLKYLLFQTFLLLLKPLIRKQMHAKYRPAYDAADKLLLLTKGFIPQYADCAGVEVDSKFAAIGNAVSFDEWFDMEKYDELKKKEVLWVGRFDDKHKRLTETLVIWQHIEKDGHFGDWRLRIVGYGPDENYYKSLVKRLGLKQCSFEGKRESLPYYRTASIFMMTSAFEGFPMVLTEAQQMAVVPMAYNTFASLGDIVRDAENGFVSREGDRKDYCAKLKLLMSKVELRKSMAKASQESIRNFSVEAVTQQWEQLFANTK